MKSTINQVKKSGSGFSIQPIFYDKIVIPTIVYQNKKKDFQVFVNKKDGGFIGFNKDWSF